MIRGEDIIEEILTFKGFWKASLIDKAKWLVVWLFFAVFILCRVISIIISIPVNFIVRLFKRRG